MELVIPKLLRKAGWSELEIDREMQQIYLRKTIGATASLNSWNTVEDFQRTPWNRRFRPTDTCAANFISYECMKLLEEQLVPPSLRSDPYAHLRKRYLEDNWTSDRFSEESARYVRREDLKPHTKGTPEYGRVSRKGFLKFEEEFKKAKSSKGDDMEINEAYIAWQESMKNQ
jgi:hypothetical protein